MSYLHQDKVLKVLQDVTGKRLKKQKDASAMKLKRLWAQTRVQLKGSIQTHYQPSTPAFNRTKYALGAHVRGIMQQFHAQSVPLVKNAVHDLHDQSILLHAWMLDQVTPKCTNIRLPARRSMREADIINDPGAFEARWASWLNAYNEALVNNLYMGAINQQPVSDATDKVDQTKAGFPAYDLLSALNRIFEWEAQGAINQGAEDIGDANEDAVEEEIWKTRGDLRVCDDCDGNEGLSVDDAGFPPLHPNCHCFTEIVPTSFSTLLRSGDEQDQALASQMEQDGVVPNALVIRNAQGDIAGKAVVSFAQWHKGQNLMVTGR